MFYNWFLFHRFAFEDDVLLKITYKIMKRFVQPNMYRLLRNGSRDEYHLADRAEEIAWELHNVLSVFEPCGDDDDLCKSMAYLDLFPITIVR